MRVTDVNQIFAGSEPKFIGSSEELSKLDLITSLNWYARNRTSKDAEEYAERYFRSKLHYSKSLNIKNISPTLGFLCRIVTNGGILPQQNQIWFEQKLQLVKNVTKQNDIKTDEVIKTPSIQDKIKEKSNWCIAELEGMFDDYIGSKFGLEPIPSSILTSLNIKYVNDVVEHFRNRRKEYDELLNTADTQLKEGYSNFNKYQIRKIIAYFDQIIVDCLKISEENKSTTTRKPRIRKVKTSDQLLSKLTYCAEFSELNLISVDPKLILGATQLWVYNTRYKKLGVYYSSDASGFSMLGTTLKNFDESRSIQKIVKDPLSTISDLMKSTKVGLRTFMNKLRNKENVLSGRINSDTLLLKVIK
jgi:hypothetical protein